MPRYEGALLSHLARSNVAAERAHSPPLEPHHDATELGRTAHSHSLGALAHRRGIPTERSLQCDRAMDERHTTSCVLNSRASSVPSADDHFQRFSAYRPRNRVSFYSSARRLILRSPGALRLVLPARVVSAGRPGTREHSTTRPHCSPSRTREAARQSLPTRRCFQCGVRHSIGNLQDANAGGRWPRADHWLLHER